MSPVRRCNCGSWEEEGLALRDIGRCGVVAKAIVGSGLSGGEGGAGGGGPNVPSTGGARCGGRCETGGLDIA